MNILWLLCTLSSTHSILQSIDAIERLNRFHTIGFEATPTFENPSFEQPRQGCPSNKVQVPTWAECKEVAAQLGIRFWGGPNGASGADPKGCIYRTPDKDIWYNAHSAGSTSRNDRRLVCISQPTPVTPSPTPSPTLSPTEEASYGNIIEWLKGLIAEGKQEIKDIDNVLMGKKDKVNSSSEILRTAQEEEGEAKSLMDEALKKLNEAKGSWEVCERNYNTEKKRLDTEIDIFARTKTVLNGLLNGEQPLDTKEVKALISLADKANPEKVKEIITLVQKLIDAANAELITYKDDLDLCKGALESAEAAYSKAVGIWEAASLAVKDKQKDLDAAQGELTTYTKYASERTGVVQDEIATMENIISLLGQLLE